MPSDSAPFAAYSPSPAGNLPVLSVSELSGALKRTIEQAFGQVRVRGEISGCKRHSSGHIYLALKDEDALIDGVVWRGNAQRLGLVPEDGMDVICVGKLTTYPGRSKYQLVIERMELAGEGALLKLLEDRKRRLAAEGLFAAERKRALPFLPRTIGIVTSPTGAVIRDILHRLADRFPRHVLVWPVAVQGEGSADQVARAIAGFNALPISGPVPRPQLLIVARGGGSLEDLMAFNAESVVRAVAAGKIPLISAVGHETDTTLIDYVADRRAPTPTAAAEMAVPVRLDLSAALGTLGVRLDTAMSRRLDEARLRVEGLARGLPEPMAVIQAAEQRLDDRTERLSRAWDRLLAERGRRVAELGRRLRSPLDRIDEAGRQLLQVAARLVPALNRRVERAADAVVRLAQVLESLSPYRVLERGYAVVEDRAGTPLAADDIRPGMKLGLRFHDRIVPAEAEGPAGVRRAAPLETRQKSLF